MGSSVTVYVGPYITIKLASRTYDVVILSCTNMLCCAYKDPTENAFCKHCGSKIVKTTDTRTGVRDWNEFQECTNYKYEDTCYSPEYLGGKDENIIISNYDNKEGIHYIDCDDGGVLSLSKMDYESSVAVTEFKENNKEMIRMMEEFFTADYVEVNYGVCSFWS